VDRSKTDERQRVLAARGWESDRDRTRDLRSLLSDHTQRIFVWFYDRVRSRDRAVELTRGALVWTSRTLDQIPEDRTLDNWIFEHLATETAARLDLRRSELGPEPTLVLGDDPNTHYLESYPTSRTFLDAHTQYRNNLEDAALLKRSGWSQVRDDIEHFLDGHFGEETPDEGNEHSPLRQRLRKQMGFRQYFELALVAFILYRVADMYLENRQLKQDVARLQTALAQPSPGDSGTPLAEIRSPQLEPNGADLRFRWQAVDGATSYRLTLYNSKMEELWTRTDIEVATVTIPTAEIGGFDTGGSYLFRVDGMKGADVVASSGFITYPPI
jgi:hypothetical protein